MNKKKSIQEQNLVFSKAQHTFGNLFMLMPTVHAASTCMQMQCLHDSDSLWDMFLSFELWAT
jgi:hypothetical protein